jgi:hypothetical protein
MRTTGPLSLILSVLVVGLVTALLIAESDARRPMPVQASALANGFLCEIEESSPPASVEAAFEEYYQCVVPLLSRWDREHTEEMETLDVLYRTWQVSRGHDLRGAQSAARWVRKHPTDFSDRSVQLTSAQVLAGAPTTSAEPAFVAGTFQRLFVDRGSDQLFLTSDEEGLVSLDISERYAFEVLGTSSQGATDFFIVDGTTAFLEETEIDQNGDLVVLDISDPSNPREVSRMRGVLPKVPRSLHLTHGEGPSFTTYRLLHEGRLISAECGQPPTVSTHPNLHCRLDGSCYRRELRDSADEGVCGQALARELPRPTRPRATTRSVGRSATGGAGVASSAAPPAQINSQRGAEAADMAMPEGGAGGAGSLSQMMVHGSSLYILRAAGGVANGFLLSFDISEPRSPRLAHVLDLDNGPEALQRHDNLLLVAGRDALSTVSIADAGAPRLLGEYRQNCPVNYDPVVVQGSMAYRTIIVDQWGSMCSSRLEVIDLSQPHQPVVRSTTNIDRPRGLAVLGERLFVANENRGVEVFDITDPTRPVNAGTLALDGVKDLVLSGFDLFAMTGEEVKIFYVAPLYEEDHRLARALQELFGITAVTRRARDAG